jgi:hypothetical protein
MTSTSTDILWHSLDPKKDAGSGEAATRLENATKAVENAQRPRIQEFKRSLRGYSQRQYNNYFKATAETARNRGVEALSTTARDMAINVTKSLVDDMTAMMCRARPTPIIVTDSSDWKAQNRARKRQQLCESVYRTQRVHSHKQPRMCKNAGTFGAGFLEAELDLNGKRINVCPVFTPEVLVDEREGIYGEPMNFYRQRPIDKRALSMLFRDNKELVRKIENAPVSANTIFGHLDESQVMLTKAWHVRTYAGAGDGRYALAIPGCILYAAEFDHDHPPLVPYVWNEEPCGFYGSSIPSDVRAIQHQINVLAVTFAQAIWYGGGTKLLNPGSITKQHITNTLRIPVIDYDPRKGVPTYWKGDVLESGLVNYMQYMIQLANQLIGLPGTDLQVPLASTSGRAQLVHEQTVSQRFLDSWRRCDTAIAYDLSERIFDAVDDAANIHGAGDMTFLYRERGTMGRVAVKDIVGDRSEYDSVILSSSGMPMTAAGRYALVEAMISSGDVTPEHGRHLKDTLSLAGELENVRSPEEVVDKMLSDIVSGEKPKIPIPEINLMYANKRATEEVLKLSLKQNVPTRVLDEVRSWRDRVQTLIDRMNQRGGPEVGAAPSPEDVMAAEAAAGLPPIAPPIPPGAIPVPPLEAVPA